MNQFAVHTNLDLPCNHERPLSLCEPKVIRIERGVNLTSNVQQVHWEGRAGGNVLRSYHVGDSILIGMGISIKMRIPRDGSAIAVDFDETNPIEPELGCAATTNLGLSLCSLLQGDLPLHGCGVSIQGRRVIIMAPSGTGKSTLLWKLLDNGALFTNDDVISVAVGRKTAIAHSSVSLHSKLSRSAILDRGWDYRDFHPTCTGSKEYWIPIASEDRINHPGKLNAIFVLQPVPHSPINYVEIIPLHSGEAVSVLMANTQGLWAVRSFLNASQLMHDYCKLLRTTPLYVIRYHRAFSILPNLVAAIERAVVNSQGIL